MTRPRLHRLLAALTVIGWTTLSWAVLAGPLAAIEDSATATAATSTDPLPMIVLGAIMVATYVAIAFELLHKTLAAMAGAVTAVAAAMIFGVYGETGYESVHHTIGHDLGVLGVLLGTSILVEIVGASGLFHFIAIKIVKKTGGDPGRLFATLAAMTVLFVSLLTIAPGTLIMVTLALAVTKKLGYDAKPYVIVIALSANSGALATFASGIVNLMVGSAANLAYVDFLRVSLPMAIISAFVCFFCVKRMYRDRIVATGDAAERRQLVQSFDEWALVQDIRIFRRCGVILIMTIVGFATAQTLGLGLDFVAMAGGVAALLFSGFSTEKALAKVKWSLIIFFIGLFVIIGAVKATGLLEIMASGITWLSGGSPVGTMLIMGVFVLVLSGIVDNIPVAATLVPVVATMGAGGAETTPLWWTLVLCANLGGNSTPVGSVASVIALHALEKERGEKIGWGEYMKVGGTVLFAQGIVVLTYLWLLERFDLFPG